MIGPVDGHDADKVATPRQAKTSRPSAPRIICKTTSARAAPTAPTPPRPRRAAGGAEEIKLTAPPWAGPRPFEIPEDVYADWDAKARAKAEAAWNDRFAAYSKAFPELAAEFTRRMKGDLPANFAQVAVDTVVAAHTRGEDRGQPQGQPAGAGGLHRRPARTAGRQRRPDRLQPHQHQASTPNLRFDDAGRRGQEPTGGQGGRHINYGVREFGMAAIMNGVALHGGFIPYGGTFLTFSDYSRNAIRMAALMKQRVIHVFTHDSIGLGEDGPTHQSIEHAASLRLIPNLDVWRPADTVETAVAWSVALSNRTKPTALALSRQNPPTLAAPKRDAGRHLARRLRAERAR